ncbi:MAG: deoxyribose-phosphate aldolase [Spirochaetia bacterium]|nr:deoxyribose-phosphate aldolase [Spirochaetia bacterium]
MLKSEDIAKYIDHTLLANNATEDKIIQLCREADEHSFASVCINSCWTKVCSDELKDSDVKVCTVVGFPLGAMKSESKAYEATLAIADGADEIDMVINVGFLKEGKLDAVEKDIQLVKEACKDKILKVIIETCLLSDEEKESACRLAVNAKADFVKTSTGFSTGGATEKDVALMRGVVKDALGVKASGGVRSYETAVAMISSGATRLGTSSGIAIIQGAATNGAY